MARVNFPNSPTNGQEYTSSGATYTYNSSKGTWNALSTLSGITSADISMATPATASSSGGINYDSAGEFTFIPAVIPATATAVYATAADLPLSDNPVGNKAFVVATKRLYLWNGSGWYNIALVNTGLTMTTGSAATYTLATDGTDTVITLVANDPEDVPITWSYAVTSGSLGSTATVSQADNVFTITPSTTDSGSFSLTFTASDGINTATSTSAFSLQLIPTGRATFLNDNPTTNAVGSIRTVHSWTVPTGVTSISILCIGAGGATKYHSIGGGGGGLSWKNNITVTPGQVVSIEAGNGGRYDATDRYGPITAASVQNGSRSKAEISGVFNVYALGGSCPSGAQDSNNNYLGGLGGGGGTAIGGGDGGGYGGNAGYLAGRYGGGGGAAGYTGNGGRGGQGGHADGGSDSNGTGHGQSGAGGGGGGGSSGGSGASGGGVGIYGQGANGNGGSFNGHTWGTPGRGGSGGEFANPGHASGTPGGDFGGGGGPYAHAENAKGGDGVVTIIWGDNRVYPSTNVDLASDT